MRYALQSLRFFLKCMVTCIFVNSSGEEIGRFQPKGERNLLDEAADEGIELPFSCHAGACMSCAAEMIEGTEMIDQELDGVKYIDTDESVCLTCISGVKKEYIESPEEHTLKVQILMD